MTDNIDRSVVVGIDGSQDATAALDLAAASADAGLLVVGSHTRGTIGGALLGSAAYRLVHTAHCPVAVVRGEQT